MAKPTKAKGKSAPAGDIVSGMGLAAHMDCSSATIGDYLLKGIITKRPDGKFNQTECRHKVLRYLRDRNAGRTGGDLSKRKSEMAEEQTLALRFKNAVMRGDYVSIALIEKAGEKMLMVFRERILSIPGKIADAMDGRSRDERETIIRDELFEALDELANPASFGGSGSRGDVRPDVPRRPSTAEVIAGRMGGSV
jgi:phage terminase Nu1 subunit (DNA packaging protein)